MAQNITISKKIQIKHFCFHFLKLDSIYISFLVDMFKVWKLDMYLLLTLWYIKISAHSGGKVSWLWFKSWALNNPLMDGSFPIVKVV